MSVIDLDVCGNVTARFAALGCTQGLDCNVTRPVVLPAAWLRCEWRSAAALHVADNVSIGCTDRATRCDINTLFCEPTICELSFSFARGISFASGASVVGGTVILSTEGRLTIAQGARVDASAMGLCGHDFLRRVPPFDARFGTGNAGAGHGGDGGQCTGNPLPIKPPFSRFGSAYGVGSAPFIWGIGSWFEPDRPLFAELYGAGTAPTFVANFTSASVCCGGGAVLVNASEGTQLDGKILADAQAPCVSCVPGTRRPEGLNCCNARHVVRGEECYGLGGASGGTVVVAGGGSWGEGTVSAVGGDGWASETSGATAGGAGGRVKLPGSQVMQSREPSSVREAAAHKPASPSSAARPH
jgi:hypothetical protein